jgi:hypothetical protein
LFRLPDRLRFQLKWERSIFLSLRIDVVELCRNATILKREILG